MAMTPENFFPPNFTGVEIRMSGNGNPPDRQEGQKTSSGTTWFREIRFGRPGPWIFCELRSWHRSLKEIGKLLGPSEVREEPEIDPEEPSEGQSPIGIYGWVGD